MRVNGKQYRTIWVDKQNPQVIKIIDQRLLPHQFVVEELRTVADFATAIREMHIRGAGLIGATAGFAMYCATLHDPGDVFMAEAAAILLATRPTAKNLAWAIARQQDEIRRESTPEARQKRALAVACRIADEDAEYCRRLGQHGLEIIREISARKNGPVNILTHCNAGWLAFVDYGSATAPIYAARDAGIDVHIWVDETRPWLQGARLTAWELGQEGLPYTLITDNTGAARYGGYGYCRF